MTELHPGVVSLSRQVGNAGGPEEERTLTDLLWCRYHSDAEAIAYEFLQVDGDVNTLTYAELTERAVATADALLQLAANLGNKDTVGANSPALILYPPGLDYIVALWACLIAGVPAVPAYPPGARGISSSLSRLSRLVSDSGAAVVLAPPEAVILVPDPTGVEPGQPPIVHVAPSRAGGASIPSARPKPGDIAIIQYTSGSTTQPRGVVLTHRNLTRNIAAIATLFELNRESRAFVWLPPYHDMGLIGGILTPLVVGFPVRLMSPLHFLKSPSTWLTQISEIGATVSGGPNFAYELLSTKFRGDVTNLNLSQWKVAFNGAEPVRRQTLHAFTDRFRPAGFQAESFLPCYGLAEATLLVTGRHWRPEDDDGKRVSCGPPVPDHDVVIVDPDTAAPLPEGSEGEIWVHGASVSIGYWRGAGRPPGDDFLANITGAPHLRTGDLGVLRAGELFVSGRIKDVLIQRGRKFHAVDVEVVATQGDPRLRPIAAAFTGQRTDEAELSVLVLEHNGRVDCAAAARDARARVLDELGLLLDVIVVAPPRTVPRTSSGKAQRSLCRQRYLSGEYDDRVVVDAERPVMAHADDDSTTDEAGPAPEVLPLAQLLAGLFSAVCEKDCDVHTSLLDLGGDSLKAAEIAAIVEDSFGRTVPVELVLAAPTPDQLARQLLVKWREEGVTPEMIMDQLHGFAVQVEGQL